MASLPSLPLDAGCTVTVEAIDPATGAAVAGVLASAFAIYAYQPSGEGEGSFESVTPLWLPLPTEPPGGVLA
jgi:hypothetical protein